VALAAGLAAGASGAQTVDSPVKVTDGPWGKSVGEPQISQLDNNFPAYSTSPNTWKYILVWQVQDTPSGGGQFEAPNRMDIAVGTYVSSGSGAGFTWTTPFAGLLPPTGWSRTRNPMIIATHDSPDWRFIAGGSALPSTGTDDLRRWHRRVGGREQPAAR